MASIQSGDVKNIKRFPCVPFFLVLKCTQQKLEVLSTVRNQKQLPFMMKDKHPSSRNNVQTGTETLSTAVSPVSGSLGQRSRK